MPISLQKGQKISLSKEAPGLTKLHVGLGWDCRETDGAQFDLDASLFLLNSDKKAEGESDFVFYGNKQDAHGAVVHQGDNLTGEGEGDDEVIKVDLTKIPEKIESIPFVVTIHDAESREQSFGDVVSAFIRLVNDETNEEIARFDLSEDSSTETGLIFGEIYRHNGDWKFSAVGQGYAGGLASFLAKYGLSAE